MRVDIAQLTEDFTDAGTLILTWEGEPFTGVAYETSPQGALWSEQTYADGVLDGVSRDFYPSGQLKSQTSYKWNRVHGPDQGWHPDGSPAYDSLHELGITLREQCWNPQGQLTKDYRIEDDAKRTAELLQERAIFSQYGLV